MEKKKQIKPIINLKKYNRIYYYKGETMPEELHKRKV